MAVVSLGSNGVGKTVVVLGAVILDAVITVFTAAIFTFKLNAFLHRFLFWECFPCPGPGIAEYRN